MLNGLWFFKKNICYHLKDIQCLLVACKVTPKDLVWFSFCTFSFTISWHELSWVGPGSWIPLQCLVHSSLSIFGHAESYLKIQETVKGTWFKHCLESKRNYLALFELEQEKHISLMKLTNIMKWICMTYHWLVAPWGQSVFWCPWANKTPNDCRGLPRIPWVNEWTPGWNEKQKGKAEGWRSLCMRKGNDVAGFVYMLSALQLK